MSEAAFRRRKRLTYRDPGTLTAESGRRSASRPAPPMFSSRDAFPNGETSPLASLLPDSRANFPSSAASKLNLYAGARLSRSIGKSDTTAMRPDWQVPFG